MLGEVAILTIIVRLLAPLLILRFPLMGILLNAVIDVYDYHFIGQYEWYQPVDKLLDVYYLGFAAFTVLRWRDFAAKRLALWAFAYRVIGVFLVLITDQRWLLLIFPNFFEPFFVFYLLFVYVSSAKKLFVSKTVALMVIASLLIPKLVQEYVLHIYQPNPTLAPGWVGEIVSAIEQMKWLGILLYLLPPVAVLVWLWFRRIR